MSTGVRHRPSRGIVGRPTAAWGPLPGWRPPWRAPARGGRKVRRHPAASGRWATAARRAPRRAVPPPGRRPPPGWTPSPRRRAPRRRAVPASSPPAPRPAPVRRTPAAAPRLVVGLRQPTAGRTAVPARRRPPTIASVASDPQWAAAPGVGDPPRVARGRPPLGRRSRRLPLRLPGARLRPRLRPIRGRLLPILDSVEDWLLCPPLLRSRRGLRRRVPRIARRGGHSAWASQGGVQLLRTSGAVDVPQDVALRRYAPRGLQSVRGRRRTRQGGGREAGQGRHLLRDGPLEAGEQLGLLAGRVQTPPPQLRPEVRHLELPPLRRRHRPRPLRPSRALLSIGRAPAPAFPPPRDLPPSRGRAPPPPDLCGRSHTEK